MSMVITANGVVRTAIEDEKLKELPPLCQKVLFEEMPKFVAWLQQPHPEIERQYREGVLGKYKGFNFFMDDPKDKAE